MPSGGHVLALGCNHFCELGGVRLPLGQAELGTVYLADRPELIPGATHLGGDSVEAKVLEAWKRLVNPCPPPTHLALDLLTALLTCPTLRALSDFCPRDPSLAYTRPVTQAQELVSNLFYYRKGTVKMHPLGPWGGLEQSVPPQILEPFLQVCISIYQG